jgi:hypothetical protein
MCVRSDRVDVALRYRLKVRVFVSRCCHCGYTFTQTVGPHMAGGCFKTLTRMSNTVLPAVTAVMLHTSISIPAVRYITMPSSTFPITQH